MKDRRLTHTSGWLAAIAVLLSVFSLYVQPDFLLLLANQVWTCF